MNGWLNELGLRAPTFAEGVSAAVALLIVVAAWAAGMFAGRRAAPALTRFLEQHAGARDGIIGRACDVVRYATIALILAIALKADAWPLLAALVIGLPLALATGLLVAELIRGLHLPRWLALTLGAAAFLAVIAEALGGLAQFSGLLDSIGFSAGRYRFSLLRLLQILVGLGVLLALIRLASRVLNHSIRRARGLDATQQLLAQKLTSVVLIIVAFFVGIDLVGIDLTALTVFSGAFGLAVGFGLQKTIGNLIAGIILLMDRSIKPGDVIAVGDSFGHVNKIGVRAVSVVTRDGKEHLIPNENLMTQEVENWSFSSPNVRIHIPVGVAYDCDLPLAQRLMTEAAKVPKRVLSSPAPVVWLKEFGRDAVEHEILVWIADPEGGVGNVQSEILNRLWVLFGENGIGLPSAQMDVRIKEWPGPPAAR